MATTNGQTVKRTNWQTRRRANHADTTKATFESRPVLQKQAVTFSRSQDGPQPSLRPPRTHLKPVIGPGPEFHDTGLLVEGEILDVDLAGRLVDGRGLPLYKAVPPQGGLGGKGHFKIAIGAERAKPGTL